MVNQMEQIAQRIKELREILEISQKDISQKIGVTLEQYLAYENAETDMPISVLYAIASVLGTDPTVLLTGDNPKMDNYTIVRDGQGLSVERYKGYSFSSIAYNYKNREMEPMVVFINRDENSHGLVSHGGQEFNYILEGTVKVILASREFVLNKGDSIYFDPAVPHAQLSVTKQAKFLTVLTDNLAK